MRTRVVMFLDRLRRGGASSPPRRPHRALPKGAVVVVAAAVSAAGLAISSAPASGVGVAPRWRVQFGTTGDEVAHAVVAADGFVYVAGSTSGSLGGPAAGGDDAFVRKYTEGGAVVWTWQFGTPADDQVTALAIADDEAVYVAGVTEGSLEGTNAGGGDAFVRKYTKAGNPEWTRQFGTSKDDQATGLGLDSGGKVYVAGDVDGALTTGAGGRDGFVRKYSEGGAVVWTRQFGTSMSDIVNALAVAPNDSVIVGGVTFGSLGGPTAGGGDGFVRAYTAGGNVTWTDQFGTAASDGVRSVAVGADGSVYAGGDTFGDLATPTAGGFDAFVRRYSGAGTPVLTTQFGTENEDSVTTVAVSGDGRVYAGGETYGTLEGLRGGKSDAFVRVADRDGTLASTDQFGSSEDDAVRSVTLGSDGSLYAVGGTDGDLESPSAGGGDGFVRRYGGGFVPEHEECPRGMSHPFEDVPAGSFAYDDIGCLYALKVTGGTTPTTYSPADTVTREQMGAFLARLYRKISGDTCGSDPSQFTDVAGSWARTDIGCILDLGVTGGTTPTTYSPGDPVTREQMAAFLARLYRAMT